MYIHYKHTKNGTLGLSWVMQLPYLDQSITVLHFDQENESSAGNFKQSIWGLGTELEQGCRTGPPGYTMHSLAGIGSFRIDSWAPKKFKNSGSGSPPCTCLHSGVNPLVVGRFGCGCIQRKTWCMRPYAGVDYNSSYLIVNSIVSYSPPSIPTTKGKEWSGKTSPISWAHLYLSSNFQKNGFLCKHKYR